MKIQALALLVLLTLPACAQDLQARISKAARAPAGMRVGVYVKLLKTGETAQVDGKRPYPLASVFKLPVMVELARQMQTGRNGLQLATRLEVSEPEKCIGSGHLQDQPDGTPVSVERLIELMETISDNTATDMLFRRIGLDSVNQMMAGLGCTNTDIFLTNRAAWLISLGQSSDFRGLDPESIAARWRSLNAEQRRKAAQKAEKENLRLTLSRFQALEDESARSNSHDQDVLVATTVDNLSSPEDLSLLLENWPPGLS